MANSVFPGFPPFLEAAANEVGHPEAAGPARRIGALAALANLCAQAADADDRHVAGILAKAAEFRDQLLVAYWAAELMLADVSDARASGSAVPSEVRPRPERATNRTSRAADPSK